MKYGCFQQNDTKVATQFIQMIPGFIMGLD